MKKKLDKESSITTSINKTTKGKMFAVWVPYAIIALVAGGIGAGAGIFIKRELGQTDIDYTGFNPESYRADSASLLKEYEKNPNKEFTPVELVNIGLEKYRNYENSYSIGIGLADTIVKQTIRNAQIKNGDEYFEESISYSSMVAISNRVNQKKGEDKVTLYRGKAKDSEKGSYSEDKEEYTMSDYKTKWGKTLNEMFIFLLSDKTVYQDECKTEKTNNGEIKVTLKLDPDIAPYYYKVQMKSISNLDKLPVFDYLFQTYYFDNEMKLLRSEMDELYKASMGVTATIHNKISYQYYAGEYLKIPALDESINYSMEGEIDNE